MAGCSKFPGFSYPGALNDRAECCEDARLVTRMGIKGVVHRLLLG